MRWREGSEFPDEGIEALIIRHVNPEKVRMAEFLDGLWSTGFDESRPEDIVAWLPVSEIPGPDEDDPPDYTLMVKGVRLYDFWPINERIYIAFVSPPKKGDDWANKAAEHISQALKEFKIASDAVNQVKP